MPVKIACPKCSKKYSLPDSAVGKAVKCKQCETTFRTRMPGGDASTSPQAAKPTARPSNPAQQKPKQPKQPKPRPAKPASPSLGEFGLDGGFQQQPDIFGSPPQAAGGLDNFADQDTFGEAVEPIVLGPAGASVAPPENPFQSVMTNSSMRGSAVRSKAVKKKRGKAGADVSAYGVARAGMMCVGGAGATMLFSSLVFLIMTVAFRVWTLNGNKVSENVAFGLGVVVLILMGLGGLSLLVLFVGQVMCMFAPNGNERFNSIGAGGLLFFALVGGVIMMLILGVAIGSMSGPGGPSAAGAITVGLGSLVVVFVCVAMMVTAMFLFVNFYRRVGQNIKATELVKVSNQATIAICASLALPLLGGGLSFILGMVGMDPETAVNIIGGFYIFSALFGLVVGAVIVRMVLTGVASLRS